MTLTNLVCLISSSTLSGFQWMRSCFLVCVFRLPFYLFSLPPLLLLFLLRSQNILYGFDIKRAFSATKGVRSFILVFPFPVVRPLQYQNRKADTLHAEFPEGEQGHF